MDRRKRIRLIIFPLFGLLLLFMNYNRISGTENIRPIHIVNLLAMGAFIGVMIRNIVDYIRTPSEINNEK